MSLLLDTCALLALADGSLSAKAKRALGKADRAIVPAFVVWEIAIKVKTGKLMLPALPLPWVEALCARHTLHLERHIPDTAILCEAADLPPIHRDPFDRVFIAIALKKKIAILTSDKTIPLYPKVKAIW